LILQMLVGEF